MTRNEEMAQMAFDGSTQREIAEKYGVSKQRVAQIVGRTSANRHRPQNQYSIYPVLDLWMHKKRLNYDAVRRLTGLAPSSGTSMRIKRILCGLTEPRKTDIDMLIRLTGLTYEQMFASDIQT